MQVSRPLHCAARLRRLATVAGLGATLAWPAFGQASAAGSAPLPSAAASDSAEIQRLIREGQHTQALKLIDEALAKNPKDPQMRFRRGVALSMLDRKNDALAVFQKLVEDHPDMPAPYNNMAVLYGAQGEYEKARGALERAIRTNPAYATAYQNLGDVYAQLASQAYSKALQLDKTDASVPPKLALLRELTGGPATGAAANAATGTTVAANTPPTPPAGKPPAGNPGTQTAGKSGTAAASAAGSGTTVAAASGTPATKPATAASTAPVATAGTTGNAAASAPPATKPATTAAAGNAIGEIESAVKNWAAAWSRRDMNGYYAAYAPEFSGNAGSRKAWEQERRERIASRNKISVEISDLRVSVNGDKATARFRQDYEGDSLNVTSRKTLQLSKAANGKWLIKQESTGG